MKLWPTLLLAMAPALAAAQEPDEPPAHTKILSVTPDPVAARVGDPFHLVFKVKIDPTWHIYSANGKLTPTSWKFDAGVPIEAAGKVEEPKPQHHKDEAIKLEYDFHEGDVTFRVPVKWTKAAKPGKVEVSGVMSGMECDPNGCILFDYPFKATLDVPIEAKVEAKSVKTGETFHLVFDLSLKPGWYTYSANGKYNPTTWEFTAGVPMERAGKVEEPKTKHVRHEDIDVEYDSLEGDIKFRVPVRATAAAKPGPLKITGRMMWQECENVCMDYDYAFVAEVTIAGVGPAPPPKAPDKQETPKAPESDKGDASSEAAKEFESKGLGWLLGIAVVGGLISLVMPCVYPLIPITITFFAKQAGASKAHGLLLSFAYAAGIILTFTGLGFLLTILLGAQGAQIFASNPWVNLVIAAVFGAFALSLLGLFEFKLPAFVTNLTGGSGPRTGVGGAFVLGLLFSVVTFTCTIPFAGTILAVAASGDHKGAGLLAMFVYSVVMAIPFLFLGLFPSMVKEIPKSGGWLHTMKVAAGLFEVALAAAYIWKADNIWGWGIFDRPVVLSIWIAVSFILSLYLLGLFKVKGDSDNPGVGIGRILSGLAFGSIGFFLVGGLLGRPLGVFGIVLPPETEQVSGTSGPKQEVFAHLKEAEEKARAEGKPVFVEFTGIT